MGLDMYAFTTPENIIAQEVDFKVDDLPDITKLHYWRKHPNLHGWMSTLYYVKGGTSAEFNCVPVRLTKEDLDQLEKDILAEVLPPTDGFFFGGSDGSEQDDDLAFIAKAREAIAAGLAVFYDSWW